MSTTEMLDYRRFDQRRYIYQPYWITSSEVIAVDSDDLIAIVFSFPATMYGESHILINKIGCQITTLMAGGTITCNVGSHTLLTNDVTSGGVATLVDDNEYVPTADITHGATAMYFAAASDWLDAQLLATELTPVIIVPADSAVPAIGVSIVSDSTITGGKCRVHALITEVPLAA